MQSRVMQLPALWLAGPAVPGPRPAREFAHNAGIASLICYDLLVRQYLQPCQRWPDPGFASLHPSLDRTKSTQYLHRLQMNDDSRPDSGVPIAQHDSTDQQSPPAIQLALELGYASRQVSGSVAVRVNDRILSTTIAGRGTAAQQLLPKISNLMDQAEIAPQQLGEIVVTLGPGSFTGLRIGLTAAKSLAYGLGIPVAGYLSLDLVAWSCLKKRYSTNDLPDEGLDIVAVSDAQRGQLFTHSIRLRGGNLVAVEGSVHGCQIMEPNEVYRILAEQTRELSEASCWIAAHQNCLPILSAAGIQQQDRVISVVPDAEALLEMHATQWIEPRQTEFWNLEPVYVRPSAAEEKAAAAKSRVD